MVAGPLPRLHHQPMYRLFPTLLGPAILASSLVGAPIIDDEVPVAVASVDRAWMDETSRLLTLTETFRVGRERVQNDVSAFVPLTLSDDGDQLLFTRFVQNIRDGGEASFSGGLGARFYLSDYDAVFGFHLLCDTTESIYENDLSQIGLGFDLFTPSGIDLHGNVYLAESGDHLAREWVDYADLFAAGHTIFQTRNLLGQFERGRGGADLKVAFDVPVLNELLPARGHVGAYHFEGNYGDDFTGAMAGLMLQPFEGVSLGAEYYADDDFFGDNWVFVAGVSAPFEIGDLFRPRKLVENIGRTFRAPSRDRRGGGMRSFMTAPVDRRDWVLPEVSSPILTKTDAVVVMDEVVFVNHGLVGVPDGSATGRGTFEDPLNTIQGGVNRAARRFGHGGTVLVGGNGRVYSETIFDAGRSVDLRGGQVPIRGFEGERFSYGRRPIINGAVVADDIPEFSLTGFTIGGGVAGFDGVLAADVSRVDISRNTILDADQDGIDFELSGTTMMTATVFRNRVVRAGDDAFDIDVYDSSRLTAVFRDNDAIGSSDTGINIDTDDRGILDLTWNGGRVFGSGGDGFFLGSADLSRATVVFENSSIRNSAIDGFSVFADDDARVDATVRGATIVNAGFDAVYLESYGRSKSNLTVQNSILRSNADDGIDVETGEDADVSVLFEGNRIGGSGFVAIEIEAQHDASVTGIVRDNTATSTFAGFGLFFEDDAFGRLRILENDIMAGGINPLLIEVVDTAAGVFQIANNRFASAGPAPANHVNVISDNNGVLDLQFYGNTSSVDVDLDEFGASVFQFENPRGSNGFSGGAVFTIDPGIDTVPFGSFGFPDPR